MAQTVSVGLHHPKVAPSIMGDWTAGSGGGRQLSTTVTSNNSPATPAGGIKRSLDASGHHQTSTGPGEPVSRLQSTSACSQPSESKWTSFDESEEERCAAGRVCSSDQRDLLPATDDGASEDDVAAMAVAYDDSLIITGVLRDYYRACFADLLEKTQGKGDAQAAAVRGQDSGVFDFFLKSKLPRDDLGKVWKLADVNEDGYLNFEEFCVAMHLIVRRVKGNFPIPDVLPPCLMPTRTPPRNVTPCAHDWTHFESMPADRKSSSLPRMRVNVSAPGRDGGSPLKDFTDCLALSTDRAKSLACPVACRMSPSDGAEGAAAVLETGGGEGKSRTTVGRSLVLSPQAPKGPPPKPPPRPVVRHVRSASLDLTKNGSKNLPPPNAPAPQLPAEQRRQHTTGSHSGTCEAAVQTDATNARVPPPPPPPPPATAAAALGVAESGSSASSSSVVKVVQQRVDDRGASCSAATPKDGGMPATSNLATTVHSAAAAIESKDWKKRCEDTNRLNALLERELKQLMQLRIGLQSELSELRKQQRRPSPPS